jgi:hypothetical protein
MAKPAAEKKAAPLPPAPPLDAIKVRDEEGERLNAGLAQYGLRVPAFGESGDGGFRLDEGVIPRRWARESGTVMALARRLAAKKEQFERSTIDRDEAREKAKVEKQQRKAKMYEGMTSLGALLDELGATAPSAGRARKAIERAHMIHRKFHFGPKEMARAREVLRAIPAIGPRPGASGAVPRSPSPSAPDGLIRVIVEANPHRAGTVQHERMELLMSFAGKSAENFMSAGGCKIKLKHAVAQGWVALDAAAPEPAAPAPAESKKTARTSAKSRVRSKK